MLMPSCCSCDLVSLAANLFGTYRDEHLVHSHGNKLASPCCRPISKDEQQGKRCLLCS